MGRTISERAYEALLRHVASGHWADRAGLPASRQLASEFKVSLITMQKVLRRAARAKVLEVSERHRAQLLPEAAARAGRRLAARGPCRRLAILVPEMHAGLVGSPVYAAMVAAIAQEAARYSITTQVVPWPILGQTAKVAALARLRFGAACAVGFRPEQMISLYLLRQRAFPVMVLNRLYSEFHIPSVRFEDQAPGYAIAEKLIALGHRNLCMVTHPSPGTGADGRVTGWVNCLEEYGLADGCSSPLYINIMQANGLFFNRAFVELCLSPRSPTAIVFAHAPWATRFLRDPQLSAKRVPAELSLCYFGTDPKLEKATRNRPLTAIVPDLGRMAECVLETVRRLMSGELTPPSIRVPMHIRVTDSIGPGPFQHDPAMKPPQPPGSPQ